MAIGLEKTIKVKPGTVIFHKGDPPDYAYVVTAGRVEVTDLREDGTMVLLATVQPKQMFGELALLEDRPRSCTVTALDGCVLLAVDKQQLMARIAEADPFIRYWALYLAERVRALSSRVGDNVTFSGHAR